ncbi:MAG: hypothetical protein IJ111_13265 [Eggerthellaceae bacterium]|nr:hypothetical protein [Eggerthellaceae bacterium]
MRYSNITWKALGAIALAAALGMTALAGCTSSSGSSAASSASESASGEAVSASSASDDSEAGDDKATGVSLISSSSASSSASASSSSASSASGSAATIASGTLVDYTNKEAGYTFKVDKAYTADTSGMNVTVYTGAKSGQVPFFRLTLMKNSTGRSVEDLMAGTMEDAKKKYQNRLAVEPVANTVTLPGKYNRVLVGFEYAYTPEGGGKTVLVANYTEEISGYFFMWSCNYYKEDFETIAAMQTAQESLQFLAS